MSMREGEFREIHAAILDTIAKTNLSDFENYAQLREYFSKFISQQKIVLFAMKNIRKDSEGKYEWKLNYLSLYNNAHKIMEEVVVGDEFLKPALFIRGGLSDYVTDDDFDEIKEFFPKAELRTIENASHWVHADNTKLFLRLIDEFVAKD